MHLLALIPALLFGIAAAIQSPTNASLAQKTGSTQATLVSFTGGLALLCILVPLAGQGNLAGALSVPKWQLIGGLYGAVTIFGLTRTIPYLGAALSTTLLVFGELAMSMLIDSFGLLSMRTIPLNGLRVAGIIALAVGIFLVYLGKRDTARKGRNDSARLALNALACFALGFLAALQAPTNSVLAGSVGYLEASFVNFAVAWIVVLAIALIKSKGRLKPLKGVRPWQLFGGLYGVIGVVSTAIATSLLGAGLMVATGTFAQLAASVCIDSKGWLGCRKIRMEPLRTIGVCVIALGIFFTAAGKIA